MVLAASRASCTKFSIPPGDPDLAARVQQLLAPLPVRRDERWGLDHGTWSALRHVYPRADIPVMQLSIDETQPPSSHYQIGARLAQLREENVLILSSGNLMHNLHAYAWRRHVQQPCDWPFSFEKRVRELLLAEDHKPLIGYEAQLGREAELAVPTPDHYLPLLSHASGRIFVFFLNRRDKMVRVPRRPRDSVAIEHRLHKLQRRTQ